MKASRAFMASGVSLCALIEFTELGRFSVEAIDAFFTVMRQDLTDASPKNRLSLQKRI